MLHAVIGLDVADQGLDDLASFRPFALKPRANPCMTLRAMSEFGMRLVLDSNVLVAALRSPTGASAGLLLAALDGKAQLLANAP